MICVVYVIVKSRPAYDNSGSRVLLHFICRVCANAPLTRILIAVHVHVLSTFFVHLSPALSLF